MTDNIQKFKGHLTIETVDKDGNVVDRWADNNMIMNTARTNMARLISGMNTGQYINKLVLGTEGHQGSDYLLVKTADDGFVKERTELFSEESGSFTYPITFESTGISGDFNLISEPDADETSTINVVQNDTDVIYTIEIPNENGNDGDTVVYTEAALYADDLIFSMKTFKGKIKDDSVTLRVIWKISL